MSATIWIGSGAVIIALIVWAALRGPGRHDTRDLGTISDSWIAQHRSHPHDPGH
jgi:hypothetical protein